jgi:hypothetical protein
MPRVVVRPKDSRDVLPAELEPLAQELREALADVAPSLEVHIDADEDEHRVGVTFIEVVHIALEGLGGVASLVAIKDAVSGVCARWMQRRSVQKNDRRPRSVSIYGPDGRIIRRVELEGAEDEPKQVDFK